MGGLGMTNSFERNSKFWTCVAATFVLFNGCGGSDGADGESSDPACPTELGLRMTLGAQDYCGLDISDLRNVRVYSNRTSGSIDDSVWQTRRQPLGNEDACSYGTYNAIDEGACRVSVFDEFNRQFRVGSDTRLNVGITYDVELSNDTVFGVAQVRVRCEPSGACGTGTGFVGDECVFNANVDGRVTCVGDECYQVCDETELAGAQGMGGNQSMGGMSGMGGRMPQGGDTSTGGDGGTGGTGGTGGESMTGGDSGTGGESMMGGESGTGGESNMGGEPGTGGESNMGGNVTPTLCATDVVFVSPEPNFPLTLLPGDDFELSWMVERENEPVDIYMKRPGVGQIADDTSERADWTPLATERSNNGTYVGVVPPVA